MKEKIRKLSAEERAELAKTLHEAMKESGELPDDSASDFTPEEVGSIREMLKRYAEAAASAGKGKGILAFLDSLLK